MSEAVTDKNKNRDKSSETLHRNLFYTPRIHSQGRTTLVGLSGRPPAGSTRVTVRTTVRACTGLPRQKGRSDHPAGKSSPCRTCGFFAVTNSRCVYPRSTSGGPTFRAVEGSGVHVATDVGSGARFVQSLIDLK